MDSYETEKLQELISRKIDYLTTVSNPNHGRKVQGEIMFLKNEILPIVQRSTILLHSEIANYSQKMTDEAIKYGCDAVMFFLPLSDNVSDICTIGVANPKTQKFGENKIENIEIDITSMGIGRRKIKTKTIDLE